MSLDCAIYVFPENKPPQKRQLGRWWNFHQLPKALHMAAKLNESVQLLSNCDTFWKNRVSEILQHVIATHGQTVLCGIYDDNHCFREYNEWEFEDIPLT